MASLLFENQVYKVYMYVLDNFGMVDRFNEKHDGEAKIGDTVTVRVIKKFNKDTYSGSVIDWEGL